MIDRSNCCPKCQSKLLARVIDDAGDNIICLASNCDWKIPSRRKEDKEIPNIHNLKREWQ